MTKVVVRLPEPKREYSEDNQRQINRALTTKGLNVVAVLGSAG